MVAREEATGVRGTTVTVVRTKERLEAAIISIPKDDQGLRVTYGQNTDFQIRGGTQPTSKRRTYPLQGALRVSVVDTYSARRAILATRL